jgi:hypothetical protein
MAHPEVADEGNDLKICRVAASILNKQSLRAENGLPSSFGVGRRAYTHPKNNFVTKYYTGPQTWMDSLEKSKQRKMDMRFGAEWTSV